MYFCKNKLKNSYLIKNFFLLINKLIILVLICHKKHAPYSRVFKTEESKWLGKKGTFIPILDWKF